MRQQEEKERLVQQTLRVKEKRQSIIKKVESQREALYRRNEQTAQQVRTQSFENLTKRHESQLIDTGFKKLQAIVIQNEQEDLRRKKIELRLKIRLKHSQEAKQMLEETVTVNEHILQNIQQLEHIEMAMLTNLVNTQKTYMDQQRRLSTTQQEQSQQHQAKTTRLREEIKSLSPMTGMRSPNVKDNNVRIKSIYLHKPFAKKARRNLLDQSSHTVESNKNSESSYDNKANSYESAHSTGGTSSMVQLTLPAKPIKNIRRPAIIQRNSP